jgi:hypothetical protein
MRAIAHTLGMTFLALGVAAMLVTATVAILPAALFGLGFGLLAWAGRKSWLDALGDLVARTRERGSR